MTLCGGGIELFSETVHLMVVFMFLGYQASISSYNRSLVERSGVARALVEVSSDNCLHYLFLGKWCVGLSLWPASISTNIEALDVNINCCQFIVLSHATF